MLTAPKYLLRGYSDYAPVVTDVEAVLRLYVSGREPDLTIDAADVAQLGISSEWTHTHVAEALARIEPRLVSSGRYIHNLSVGQDLNVEEAELACTPRRGVKGPNFPTWPFQRYVNHKWTGPRLAGKLQAWWTRPFFPGELVMVDAPVRFDNREEVYCLSDFPQILANPSDAMVKLEMSCAVRSVVAELLRDRSDWYPLSRVIGTTEGEHRPSLRVLQVQTRRPRAIVSETRHLRTEAYEAAAYLKITDETLRADLASVVAYHADKERKPGATLKDGISLLRQGARLPLDDWKSQQIREFEANPYGPGIGFWLGLAYLAPDWDAARSNIDFHFGKDLMRTYRNQFNSKWMKDSRFLEIMSWVHLTRRGMHLLRKRLETALCR